MRIGHGYDIHRFEASPSAGGIILGGVKIPYDRGIVAHSDGDVVIHAICDALLGALGLGDIGEYFPDTDPAYRGCDSRALLSVVMEKMRERGYGVGHVDVTILAQQPKITPHKSAMRACLAGDLEISVENMNIKASTHEGLDAVGQSQGIAVHAVVLLEKR